VVLLWLGALAWLVVREYGPAPEGERAAPRPLALPPTTTFYALDAGPDQVGIFSLTTDTLPDGLRVTARSDVDVPLPLVPRRLLTNIEAVYDRRFRLRSFSTAASGEAGQVTLAATIDADTLLTIVATGRGYTSSDTVVMSVPADVLLPDAIPLGLASRGALKRGTVTVLQVLDPVDFSVQPAEVRVGAESTFTLADSAVVDLSSGAWVPAGFSSERAWQVTWMEHGLPVRTWIDRQGEVIERSTPLGLTHRRGPFEIVNSKYLRRRPRNVQAAPLEVAVQVTAPDHALAGGGTGRHRDPARRLAPLRAGRAAAGLHRGRRPPATGVGADPAGRASHHRRGQWRPSPRHRPPGHVDRFDGRPRLAGFRRRGTDPGPAPRRQLRSCVAPGRDGPRPRDPGAAGGGAPLQRREAPLPGVGRGVAGRLGTGGSDARPVSRRWRACSTPDARDGPAGRDRIPGRGGTPDACQLHDGAMIELRALSKNYGRFTAVDQLTLEVPKGELFGFLGPNGAGKTTTLRMIAGILQPTAGTVIIGGEDIQQNPEAAKAKLGFVPDRPYVYEKLTGAEFLRFVAALFGQEGASVERRLDELLELFELTPWKDELTESYSHGMRQKLLISSALVHRPEVVVVDEPMIGLDPKSARTLKDLLRAFVQRGGTVLMSTHTLEVAEAMCDRIAIVHHGRLAASGTMDDLRRETASEGLTLERLFLKLTGGEVPATMTGMFDD